MRKKLLSIILSLALVITVIPAFGITASAHDGAPYYIWVAGTWVTDANKNNVLGDGTVSYDPATRTLTLNNANITGKVLNNAFSPGIYLDPENNEDAITIKLVGNNTVKGAYTEGNSAGIHMTCDLVLTGSGSLTAEGGIAMTGDSFGIETYGKVIIESGTINAIGGSAGRYRGGIDALYGITIRGGNVRTSVSAPTGSRNFGLLWYYGGCRIQGGVVTVSAGTPGTGSEASRAFWEEPDLSGYGSVPEVLWSSDRTGSGAVTWDGKKALSDNGTQYVSIGPNGSVQKNPFVDVSAGDYWYTPVLWAYYHDPQITNGMDASHFGPASIVTRGQAVTFLWRAAGKPEPTSSYNPFVDVPNWQYYYKPILWAVEKGITKGTDATHFSPDLTLSTAHMITFLYRSQKPGKDGWYEEAANWSYDSNHLPFGVSLKVDDATDCPRGAVVTFLYRCLESPVVTDPLKVAIVQGEGSSYDWVTVVASGGVSPYKFQWKKKDGSGNWSDYGEEASDISWHLGDGVFRCKVTDSKGDSIYSDVIVIQPDPNLPPTHKVAVGTLNVRQEPDEDSLRIGSVTLDKEVTVIQTAGGWSRIIYGSGSGWVLSKYLSPL